MLATDLHGDPHRFVFVLSARLIARFEYVGPERDVRTTYGNGAVLDKRNFAGTQTTSGPGAGYDANRRHVRHEWQTSGGAQITAYVNTYTGPGGIGTNRRSSETREHLFGHTDTYGFDSAYRMLSFLRNDAVASARGPGGGRAGGHRRLSAAGEWDSSSRRGISRDHPS